MKYKYSIIIPYHSNEILLKNLLRSVVETTPSDCEKIVIVNNNDENKINIQIDKCFKVHRIQKNLTYPKAINFGVNNAKGDILIFCDSDTYCTPNWFNELTSFYAIEKNTGMASSKLIDPNTGRIIDFGIAFTNYNAPHPGRDKLIDFPIYNVNKKVQAACSANMIISKEIFNSVKGFNEDLPYSYCDIDLCLRLKEYKLNSWIVANSIIYHKGTSKNMTNTLLKGDVKGKFLALNAKRITIDMDKYFIASFINFKRIHKILCEYFLIDFTNILDKEWHYKIIEENLPTKLVDIFHVNTDNRDSNRLSLYDILGTNIQKLRHPIIYFVDRFIALQDNHLWWNLRKCDSDIVIDRNGNIDMLRNVVIK